MFGLAQWLFQVVNYMYNFAGMVNSISVCYHPWGVMHLLVGSRHWSAVRMVGCLEDISKNQ